jgi:ornithine cyclodeaminase
MLILSCADVGTLIKKVTLNKFFSLLRDEIIKNYKEWDKFEKSIRIASYVKHGVLELMPIHNNDCYTFKYVNCHPNNKTYDKLTIVSFGMLASVLDGYPKLYCDMTLLTAIRTACVSSIVANYVTENKRKYKIGIIGSGVQADFHILAFLNEINVDCIYLNDLDYNKAKSLTNRHKELKDNIYVIESVEDLCSKSDIIITLTAAKAKIHAIKNDWLQKSEKIIIACGGDAPGKTELDPKILMDSELIVQYLPQTLLEGEIQNISSPETRLSISTVHELFTNNAKLKKLKQAKRVVFDSVGFAIEDFSAMTVIYDLAKKYKIGMVNDNFFPKDDKSKPLISYIH